MTKDKVITVKMPLALWQRLKDAADADTRSVNNAVLVAVKDWLSRQESNGE